MAVLLSKRVAPLVKAEDIVRVEEGRFLAVPIRTLTKGISMWAISIYAPCVQKEKENFWKKVIPNRMELVKARSSTKDMVLVGTDANITTIPEEDINWEQWKEEVRKKRLGKKRKEAENMLGWMEEDYMVDIWRIQNEGERKYTWGHVGTRNRREREDEKKEEKEKEEEGRVIPERRIDYLLANTRSVQICTGVRIMEE